MQCIVNSQTPCWSDGNLTVFSPEAVINSGYTSYRLRSGQFSLQQPWQRSAALQTQQQKQPPAGSKRHSDGAPKHPVYAEEHQQQLHKDIELILQAHRQLLQLCQQGNSGTSDAAAHQQADAETAGGNNSSGNTAVANAEAPESAAATSKVPGASCAAGDSIAEDSAADWPAVAAMKRVLKPSLSFQYMDQQGNQHSVDSKLFGTVISNPSSSEVVASAYDRHVLLPPGCSFCMSDIKGIQPFVQAVQEQGGADVLLVDPPWENASARRSATYSTLTPNHLLYLPVRDIVHQASCSLVALWVTNRPRMHRFIQQQLLPAWGLQHVATWFWLKVTDAFEPVTPLSSLHRHPFEQLWLLRPVLQQQAPAAAASRQSAGFIAAAAAATAAATQADAGHPGSQVLVDMAAAVAPSATTAAAKLVAAVQTVSQVVAVAAATAATTPVPEGSLHQHNSVDSQTVGANVPPVNDRLLQTGMLQEQQQHAAACTVAPTAPAVNTGVHKMASSDAVASAGAAAAQQAHLLQGDTVGASSVLQPPDRQVIVSVPGAHSRKPHIRHLLLPYVQQHDGKDAAAVKTANDSNSIHDFSTISAPASSITAAQATGQPQSIQSSNQSLQTAKAVAAPDLAAIDETSVEGASSSKLVQYDRVAGKQPALFVELFARELFPSCMSWGNEVLKFQDLENWCSDDK